MHASVFSSAIAGVNAFPVEVEVDISRGVPAFRMVGLAEGAVREAFDRIKASVHNSGFEFPNRKVTINLAPADACKEEAAFDLPMALGILAATGFLQKSARMLGYLVLGELALDGRVKAVKGALASAILARARGFTGVVLPRENVAEASVLGGNVAVLGVDTLREACDFFDELHELTPTKVDLKGMFDAAARYDLDFSEVKGQGRVKRALEVAAAGGHNVLMIGPQGSGKTMLAKRLPTILPAMTFDEVIETTKVHSVIGQLDGSPLIAARPFRAPHHTISAVGLIGGGPVPRPGEVSLAHHGVLFLDELPEFRKNVVEVLRRPLEDGLITIAHSIGTVTLPANVMLIAAMNPCPCGFYADQEHECTCSPIMIQRYRSRLSGPLLDRIDIHIEVPAVKYKEVADRRAGESSSTIRERVNQARQRQLERFKGTSLFGNAQMGARELRAYCQVEDSGERLLELAINRLGLSARAYTRILKVARTIADLDGVGPIQTHHVSEAIEYRSLDRMAI